MEVKGYRLQLAYKEVLNNLYFPELTATSLANSRPRHWVSSTAWGAKSSENVLPPHTPTEKLLFDLQSTEQRTLKQVKTGLKNKMVSRAGKPKL